MTAREMIQRYRITLTQDRALYVPGLGKLPVAQQNAIRAAKEDIFAEFDRMAAEKAAEEKAARDRIINGDDKIQTCYHDGEILGGYMVCGLAAELLSNLGLAKQVQGWGYIVDDATVAALGTEFTYAQAAEYARPALEARAARKTEAEVARQAKFDEAKTTGKPVVLRTWSEDCNDPREECDIDTVTEYAMPDGSTKIDRRHTW